MPIKETTRFVSEVSPERFRRNRDRLMKLVESDLRLIAWVCWGFGLLFKNLSYQEMFEYIGKATTEELQEFIVPVDTLIDAENAEGVLLDKRFELREAGVVTGYLGIENQLNIYPYMEIEARQVAYFGSELFWEAEGLEDRKHYRLLVPPTFLWVFPEGPEKSRNFTDTFPVALPGNRYQRNLNKGGSLEPKVLKPRFQIKSDIYQFYLGSPTEIDRDFLVDTSKAGKETYVLLLLDLVFGFEVSKEVRLEMLDKIFNLRGKIVEEEAEIMNEFELWSMQREQVGREKGLLEGKEEERKQNLKNLTNYLLKQSKQNGRILTEKEAFEKASEILS